MSAAVGQRPQEEREVGRAFGQSSNEVAAPLGAEWQVHLHGIAGVGESVADAVQR